jgi:hypothetical protein
LFDGPYRRLKRGLNREYGCSFPTTPSPDLPVLFRESSMGMRIGNSAAAGTTQSVGASNWQQRQQSVKDVMSALQAGDLSSAQKAFGTLPGANNIASSDSNSPLAQIGKALQSGDLAAAQQAAQTWQSARSGHHHHHTSAQTASPAAGTTPLASAGTGTLLNLTA